MHSVFTSHRIAFLAALMSYTVPVSAQQGTGAPAPILAAPSTTPSVTPAPAPTQSAEPTAATASTPADASAPPAPVPSTNDVLQQPATNASLPMPAPAPAALNNADLDQPNGPTPDKKKKKLKGKKARKAAARANENLDAEDLEWGDPWGDKQDELRAAGLSFKFLLQTHYRQTFAYKSENANPDYRLPEETLVRSTDGWDLNRLFFRMAAEPNKYVGLKIITDFAEFAHNNGQQAIKQAYADIRPIPKHLHFQAGVLKLPFSITELDPIAKYEFTRMGQSNDLVKGMGFAGRDIGVQLLATPLSKPRYLTLAFGTFRGHANAENGNLFGELGARAATEPIKGLRFGINGIIMPKSHTYLNAFDTAGKDLLPNPENPSFPRSSTWDKGQAASADVTYHARGLMLRTEGMIGTRIDHDTLYGASKFGAVWAIAAYRFPIGDKFSLQPALQAELLDTDLDHKNGLRTELTAGVATYFTKAVRFLLDVERTIVQDNSPYIEQPLPLRATPYNALSNTCITGQVQVVL